MHKIELLTRRILQIWSNNTPKYQYFKISKTPIPIPIVLISANTGTDTDNRPNTSSCSLFSLCFAVLYWKQSLLRCSFITEVTSLMRYIYCTIVACSVEGLIDSILSAKSVLWQFSNSHCWRLFVTCIHLRCCLHAVPWGHCSRTLWICRIWWTWSLTCISTWLHRFCFGSISEWSHILKRVAQRFFLFHVIAQRFSHLL